MHGFVGTPGSYSLFFRLKILKYVMALIKREWKGCENCLATSLGVPVSSPSRHPSASSLVVRFFKRLFGRKAFERARCTTMTSALLVGAGIAGLAFVVTLARSFRHS